MRNKINPCWIDYEYENYYLDSPKKRLRIIYKKDITIDVKNCIKKYINYLRKKYFFPVRCYIYVTNNIAYKSNKYGKCHGVFLGGEENKSGFPSIYLPFKISKENEYFDVLYGLTKLLTYYFQWFFLENKNRSYRSLEIEATKYANYLAYDYFELNDTSYNDELTNYLLKYERKKSNSRIKKKIQKRG